MTIKRYKTVDLFSGIGGLSLGFENAGFDLVAAFDNWDTAISLYEKNFSHPIHKCDLSDIAEATKVISQYEPELIIGGPPCQDFSSAGKRDERNGRADLTIAFAEIVKSVRPRFFVMENVARALSSNAFLVARELLKGQGYGLTIKIIDASYCGVPQIRKRLFMVGEKGGEENFLLPFIEPKLSSQRLTIRDSLGDKFNSDYYYRHPRSYKRRGIFSIDEPSPTIRGVNRPVPAGYPGHSGDPVPMNKSIQQLTTNQRALIQTFPETFYFEGSKTDLEQAIGNAVPVKLAEFVGSAIYEYISKTGSRELSSKE